MATRYYEDRSTKSYSSKLLSTDIAAHLSVRQHLGSAVVICEQPATMMATVRRQWMQLIRNLQKERARTINADRILRLTHSIAHMQRMRFVSKAPEQEPLATVFFVTPSELRATPFNCFSVHITCPVATPQLAAYTAQLPDAALISDHTGQFTASSLYLTDKSELIGELEAAWREVLTILERYDIDIVALSQPLSSQARLLNEALDSLLNNGNDFLPIASVFRRKLELAQPLELSLKHRQQYEIFSILAHRVHTLTPTTPRQDFDYLAGQGELFFLRDHNADDTKVESPLLFAMQ